MKARLKGEKVSYKIIELENRFAAVLRNVDTNAQKNNTTNDGDVKYSNYWYPQMSKTDLEYVKRRAKYELDTTENYIDNITKWLYNVKNGNTYFALYSTEDANEPTILYACKASRAKNEQAWFVRFIEELRSIDNGNYEQSTSVLNQMLETFWNEYKSNNRHSGNGLGRGSNNRNVRATNQKTNFKPSEALFNCLRNIAKISDTDGADLNKGSAFSMPENDGNSYSFGDIDKGNKKRDNISRANEQGELINEFYYALDKSEWNLFYRKIAESGFLEKTDVGDVVAVSIGGKLIIAERQMTGTDAHDFQLVDAYQENNGDSFIINEIADSINESEDIYDQRTVEKTILRVSKIYDETPIFSVYDREHMQFISSSSFGKTNGRSTTTDGGYRTRTYGEGISSSTEQNMERSEAGLDNSAFSMPENDDEVSYSFEDDVVDKTSSLAERVRLGEISQTEYLNELQRLMNEATEKYGAIPKGENPKVDVTVPKQVSDKRNTRRKNNKKES